MAKITKRTIDALKQGEIVWDSEIKGFGARCQRKAKTYVLKFRAGGRQRWYTIGKHGSPWTVDQARTEAKRLLGVVAEGKDPAANRDAHERAFLRWRRREMPARYAQTMKQARR